MTAHKLTPNAMILSSISLVRDWDLTIARGGWGVRYDRGLEVWVPHALSDRDPSGCVCALGALLLALQPPPAELPADPAVPVSQEATAAKVLGVSETWIDSFVSGFDRAGQPQLCAPSRADAEARLSANPDDSYALGLVISYAFATDAPLRALGDVVFDDLSVAAESEDDRDDDEERRLVPVDCAADGDTDSSLPLFG
jgi:hypothetical protein